MTMQETLLCAFSVGTALLFEEASKATSMRTLIGQLEIFTPQLAQHLRKEIEKNRQCIKVIEQLRHQVYAHRWKKKAPQDVFAELRPCVSMMSDVVKLARFIILELAGQVSVQKRESLQNQQLSEHRLQCIAEDAGKVVSGFCLINPATSETERL